MALILTSSRTLYELVLCLILLLLAVLSCRRTGSWEEMLGCGGTIGRYNKTRECLSEKADHHCTIRHEQLHSNDMHRHTHKSFLNTLRTTSLSFQFASENGCVFDKCKRSHPAHRPHMNRVQVQINVSCMVLTLMPSLKQQVNITCVVVAPQLRCKRRGRPGWDEAQQTEQNIGVESCNLKVWISCDSCEPPTQTEEWRKAYRVKFQSRAERDSP